jgi:hypothetical protein
VLRGGDWIDPATNQKSGRLDAELASGVSARSAQPAQTFRGRISRGARADERDSFGRAATRRRRREDLVRPNGELTAGPRPGNLASGGAREPRKIGQRIGVAKDRDEQDVGRDLAASSVRD